MKAAVYDAISYYNDDNNARKKVLKVLGVIPGIYCDAALSRMDKDRIKKADFQASVESKKRKTKASERKGFKGQAEENNAEDYAAGAFYYDLTKTNFQCRFLQSTTLSEKEHFL